MGYINTNETFLEVKRLRDAGYRAWIYYDGWVKKEEKYFILSSYNHFNDGLDRGDRVMIGKYPAVVIRVEVLEISVTSRGTSFVPEKEPIKRYYFEWINSDIVKRPRQETKKKGWWPTWKEDLVSLIFGKKEDDDEYITY